MNILVTGGLGVIGRPLVRELRERGHETWTCDLVHDGDPRHVRCDVGSFSQVQKLFEGRGFDLVYHLAAEFGRWNGEDYYDTLWRTNAIGTKNMIRMQERHRFRMVFSSSSEVYGDFKGMMLESVMDRNEIRQLNDYALSKWTNEIQIMNSAAMHGTETVRIRLFNTYGPGEYYSPYRSVVCRFIYCALHDIPYTVYLNHRRTSTYISDVVRTLGNIAERFNPGEVYNIGGDQHHDIRRLSDLILKCLGKSDRLVAYRDSEPFTTADKFVSVEKAARDLDHRSLVPLEEGIPLTVDWMKSVYGGKGAIGPWA
jgi:dTDP-glucose 4,6-dehydratase